MPQKYTLRHSSESCDTGLDSDKMVFSEGKGVSPAFLSTGTVLLLSREQDEWQQ